MTIASGSAVGGKDVDDKAPSRWKYHYAVDRASLRTVGKPLLDLVIDFIWIGI